MPLRGGAASNWPITEKRKRAHCSWTRDPRRCDTPALPNARSRNRRTRLCRPATGMLCGPAMPVMQRVLIPLDVAHHSGMISPGVMRPLLAPIRSRLSALRRGTWMPTERLAMRHVRDVIRLKSAGMSTREIARRLGTAPSTVRLTIRRFEAAGLTWPLPDDVTDAVLEVRLFANAGAGPGTRRGQRRQTEPDWAAVHRELRRKHVTLSIVWEEYIAGEPGGYRYSRFCELYRAWEGRLSVTMRQSHAAGDK